MWIQTGVTVRKQLSWVVTSVTLTFDLWPFAWTSHWSLVITPKNFMMIRWWEHSQKGVTDGQMDRRTENTIHRAAWSQLKIITYVIDMMTSSNGNIFRTNGPLCGEHRSPVNPSQKPVTQSSDVLFDLRINKRVSKQSRRWASIWVKLLLVINCYQLPIINCYWLLKNWWVGRNLWCVQADVDR